MAGKERGNEGWALFHLAEIAADPRALDRETADRHYRQALAIATDLGMRPLIAHCHFGLGRIHQRAGDTARGHQHLGIATTLYREMQMRFWLEQVDASSSS